VQSPRSLYKMTSKRKTDSDSLTVREKREIVARAIANATRVDATGASGTKGAIGASERFPLPGLAFKGDSEELHLPLTANDTSTRKIKTRASIVQQPDSVAGGQSTALWEVSGASLELRNPRWAAFLDECATTMREKLAIASTAVVTLSLRNMTLAGVGAQLHLDHEHTDQDEKKVGDAIVFGSFVVVLPSTFESGESGVFRLPLAPEATNRASFWGRHEPSTPTLPNIYDLQYAAFYNDSQGVVEPVACGEALFLVYDLVTTTPSEMPLVAGPKLLQQVLNDALFDYFDIVPASLAKRFKLNEDASRSVNEFLTDRRFLYPVAGSSFEKLLYGKDRQVADRLAAFCRQSQGQYALYLAEMSCVRKKHDYCVSTYAVSLHGPCVRHGETRERMFPRTPVRFYDELSHSGFLERLQYLKDGQDEDVDSHKTVHAGDPGDVDWYSSEEDDDNDDRDCKTKRYCTNALVVQPVTVEHALWAKGPFKRLMEKLQELAEGGSREEASRLVRRVLSTKRDWSNEEDRVGRMFKVVLELDDATVFHDFLRSVKCFAYEEKNVPRGIQHFGLAACLTTVESILDDPRSTFRSRVNLVCMALFNASNTDHIDHLMHKLATVAPWSRPPIPTETTASRTYSADPYEHELTRLFELAFRSSADTLLGLIGEPQAVHVKFCHLLPALVTFTKGLPVADRSLLLPVVCSLGDTLDVAMKENPSTSAYISAVDAINLLLHLTL
jgi:hypothetical protein